MASVTKNIKISATDLPTISPLLTGDLRAEIATTHRKNEPDKLRLSGGADSGLLRKHPHVTVQKLPARDVFDPFHDLPSSANQVVASAKEMAYRQESGPVVLVGSCDDFADSAEHKASRRRLADDRAAVNIVRALLDWGGWLTVDQLALFASITTAQAKTRATKLAECGLLVQAKLRDPVKKGNPKLVAVGLGKRSLLAWFRRRAVENELWPENAQELVSAASKNHLLTNLMAAEVVRRLVLEQPAVSGVVPLRHCGMQNLVGTDTGTADAALIFGAEPQKTDDGRWRIPPTARLLIVEFDRSVAAKEQLRTKVARQLAHKVLPRKNIATLTVTLRNVKYPDLDRYYLAASETILHPSDGRGYRMAALQKDVRDGVSGAARTSGLVDVADWFPAPHCATNLFTDGAILAAGDRLQVSSLEKILSASDPVSWLTKGVRPVHRLEEPLPDDALRDRCDSIFVSDPGAAECNYVTLPGDFSRAKGMLRELIAAGAMNVFVAEKLLWPNAEWAAELRDQLHSGLPPVEIPAADLWAHRLIKDVLQLKNVPLDCVRLAWPNEDWVSKAQDFYEREVTKRGARVPPRYPYSH